MIDKLTEFTPMYFENKSNNTNGDLNGGAVT